MWNSTFEPGLSHVGVSLYLETVRSDIKVHQKAFTRYSERNSKLLQIITFKVTNKSIWSILFGRKIKQYKHSSVTDPPVKPYLVVYFSLGSD